MSDESDNFYVSDDDIDEKNHDKLVGDILNLNKVQNVKKPSRTEPTLQISEYNLVKSGTGNKGSVHVNELIKGLKGRKKHEEFSKKVQLTSKSKPLPAPLEKPQTDRIRRTVNYEKSRLQLDRWEALVTSNRAAAHLSFPLDSIDKIKIEAQKAETFPSTWRLKSELEKELEKIQPKVEEFHINTEEKEQFPLTLEELKERRREASKLRAHQSYKEAKARQQNKIKSKKYHRILRREKIKQKLKEFEELQKTNPEEALKKLDDIEKARAEERFSLRHKGTGQWARNKQIRAKYDKESRQVLAQQLAISRDLTRKLKSTDSEDEGIASEENSNKIDAEADNPWISGIKPDAEVADFVSGYRKYWKEQNKNPDGIIGDKVITNGEDHVVIEGNNRDILEEEVIDKLDEENSMLLVLKDADYKGNNKIKKDAEKKKKKIQRPALNDSVSTSPWEVSLLQDNKDIEDIFDSLEGELARKLKQKFKKVTSVNKSKNKKTKKLDGKRKVKVNLTMPSQSTKQVIDEEMIEQPIENDTEKIGENTTDDMNYLKSVLNIGENKNKETANIDPNKFVEVQETNLHNAIPDILMTDENEEETSQRDIILEAFQDDDIAVDFEKEKIKEIDKDTPKDIDLNLPGWGSWAGGNINPNKRKRKRFIIKMPKKMPRKDENKGSLIINEKAQSKVKLHMVSEVPFPFKSIKDYEASIRAPISNSFVPETAFRKLIEPAITTKMGSIIEPINKNILMGKRRV